MTVEEVRRIDPRLVRGSVAGNFELANGIRLRAGVYFGGEPERAVSVSMWGNGRVSRVVEALTARYGPPAATDNETRFIDVPVDITGGLRTELYVRMRWCDGPRVLTLMGQDQSYSVEITAAP